MNLQTSEIAYIFGVTPQRVRQWATDHDCPKVDRDKWDPRAVMEWYLGWYRQKDPESELEDSKARYWAAKADKERISADKLRGKLVNRNEVIRAWVSRVMEVTSGLEAFAKRLPPRRVGKNRAQMTIIIKDEVRNLRNQYARKGRYTP